MKPDKVVKSASQVARQRAELALLDRVGAFSAARYGGGEAMRLTIASGWPSTAGGVPIT